MSPFLRRRGADGDVTRIFFASDIHGSERTFRKFVNAAAFYGADALVFGGDLTGKGLVPIVAQGGGRHRGGLPGEEGLIEDAAELDHVRRRAEDAGLYWTMLEPEEYAELSDDPLAREGLFVELARDRLAAWVAFAEDRLAGSHVRCFLTGGNDDSPAALEVLDGHDGERVVASEGRVVDLDDDHSMITVGYSTPTPWDTPREASEEVIAGAIETSLESVADPSRCVFNLHVPPLRSGLDLCAALDTSTDPPTPVRRGGQVVWTSAGSQAVGDAIRRHQPVLGLHGHIHESAGRTRLGRTPCFNPGSEYSQGTLRGLLVGIADGRVKGYQSTAG